MDIQTIIILCSEAVAGIISCVSIPLLIKRFVIKHLKKKIDEVSETEQLKEIKNELKSIKKEILEMRGKSK